MVYVVLFMSLAKVPTIEPIVTPCLASTSEGVTVTGAEEYPVFESFDDYDLNEQLLRGIYSYGFDRPRV